VNRVNTGRARVILLARSSPDFWKAKRAAGRKTDLLIMTSNQQKVREAGITLAVSPYRVNTCSPIVGIKSLNYLENVLAWEEAQSRQFDEAVMLNERGEVVSATMANIFWVKDGTIHTPTMSTGIYDGVTRAAVLRLAEKQFIPVLEGIYDMADLTEAEEIFLTSASLGLAIVTTFDFRQYGVTQESIAARLRSDLQELIASPSPQ
jgi:branched-subunit amino acid aminotransferase/4-amino-4-deoxychorismate lyase